MKTEQCLMCIVCFVLGWFVHNVVGKCGFGTEHLKVGCKKGHYKPVTNHVTGVEGSEWQCDDWR